MSESDDVIRKALGEMKKAAASRGGSQKPARPSTRKEKQELGEVLDNLNRQRKYGPSPSDELN